MYSKVSCTYLEENPLTKGFLRLISSMTWGFNTHFVEIHSTWTNFQSAQRLTLVWRWLDGFSIGSILLAHGFGFCNAYFVGNILFAKNFSFLTLQEVIMTNGPLLHFYPLHPSLWGILLFQQRSLQLVLLFWVVSQHIQLVGSLFQRTPLDLAFWNNLR